MPKRLLPRARTLRIPCLLATPAFPRYLAGPTFLRSLVSLACFASLASFAHAAEFHVSQKADDRGDGSAAKPFRTIGAAAAIARAGDTITVHEGLYRERVSPPRGGTSDAQRIVYRAAPGEKAVIAGSEIVTGWKPFAPGVWKVAIPNTFFGGNNPYKELIQGDWFTDKGRPHHTGEVYLNGRSLFETHLLERVLHPKPHSDAREQEASTWTWFCEVDDTHTYLYANFHDKDPNRELVEINVRDACFYPTKPGCDWITVRGFEMRHAATQWAAPTAEQIGLLGTHWSKGWIIEHNRISDSKCSGITLGKDRATGHNVWNADRSKDGAVHYNEVVDRALAAGWSRDRIGSHLVRHNVISHCEQTGICGSLGAVFREITDNHIHTIWAKRQFTGAEMAGIKLHAAIDVLIARNRIHNAGRALWMDWMAQGTRLTRNLCYDNTTDDLFLEVNHGPCLVDNNLFLSPVSIRDWSQGSAFAHNLLAGTIDAADELRRFTPYHRAHSTAVAGRDNIPGGDNRWYNNLFAGPPGEPPRRPAAAKAPKGRARQFGHGTWVYDERPHPSLYSGNTYLGSARPAAADTTAHTVPQAKPRLRVLDDGAAVFLLIDLDFDSDTSSSAAPPANAASASTGPVATELLGRARVAGLPYENADGSAVKITTDYHGEAFPSERPTAGPFAKPPRGEAKLRVW